MTLIPSFRRQRRVDFCDLEVKQVPARIMLDPVSKSNNKVRREEIFLTRPPNRKRRAPSSLL